jgi:hypothetical protein
MFRAIFLLSVLAMGFVGCSTKEAIVIPTNAATTTEGPRGAGPPTGAFIKKPHGK